MKRSRGFTLIELLTAVALMSLLAGSLYTSLYTAFRARRSGQEALEPLRTAAAALELLGRDLRLALPPGGVLAGGFLGDIDEGLLLHRPGEAGDEREGEGDIRRVRWRLEPGTDMGKGGGRLLRTVYAELLAPEEPEGREDVVCRGVLGFDLLFFDGQDWLETWDSQAQGQSLPLALAATIEMEVGLRGSAAGGSAAPDRPTPTPSPGGGRTETAAGGPGQRLERVFLLPATPVVRLVIR